MPDRTFPDYLRTLAAFAAGAKLSDLSVAARDRARWIIADCIPVVAAGMQQPEMKTLVERHLARAGQGGCWVIGANRRAAPLDAALLNGTAGTWLELDEGNLSAAGHPGIQVVPAAVAVAQDIGARGDDLLLAVALGYEISSRINRASQVRFAVHPHGTFGTIGAAVAGAKLKRFNAAQMMDLINSSATMGMATSRNAIIDGATVRNIYTGHSGYMGLMAVQLVECGFTGESDAVYQIYGRVISDGFERAKVIEGLGSEWLIAKSYFKLHPVGRYAHSVIDALEDLLATVPGGRLDVDQIEHIDVRAYMRAAMLGEKNVRTSFQSRFSVPFGLASIIYHGRSGLAPFEQAAVDNPKIQALTQRVDLREDESFTARYPQEQPVTVRIAMRDGAVHEGRCTVTKGEPGKPHKPEELTAKFFELGEPVWGNQTTKSLYDGLMHIEDIADFRAFADGFKL